MDSEEERSYWRPRKKGIAGGRGRKKLLEAEEERSCWSLSKIIAGGRRRIAGIQGRKKLLEAKKERSC